MRWRAVLPLAADNLRRNRFFLFVALLGVACGVAVLTFFVGLGLGIRENVIPRLFDTLPETRLKVTTEAVDLGLLGLAFGDMGRGPKLNPALAGELSALSGVERVYSEMNVTFPIKASGNLFGHRMAVDLIATGLDPAEVAGELETPERFVFKETGVVPVVISRRLLDLYNSTLAPMNKLPELKEATVKGLRFDMVLGRSYLGGKAEQGAERTVQCEILGFSTKAVALGVTMPMEYVRRWNEEFTGRAAGLHAIYVDARDPGRVTELQASLAERGLKVQTAKEGVSKTFGDAVLFVTGLFALLSATIMVLAALSLGFLLFLMVERRTQEIGLWRTAGATRLEMAMLVLIEAEVAGLLGWVLGTAGAYGLSFTFTALVSQLWPSLPEGLSLFEFPLWIGALGLGYALVFSFLGALAPAFRAAKLDPVKSLRG